MLLDPILDKNIRKRKREAPIPNTTHDFSLLPVAKQFKGQEIKSDFMTELKKCLSTDPSFLLALDETQETPLQLKNLNWDIQNNILFVEHSLNIPEGPLRLQVL